MSGGVVISNLWLKHLLKQWISLFGPELMTSAFRPQKRRGSAWTVFIADFASLDRHLHQQGWMVAQVVPAERWMRNPLDQFVSVYELEWRFHSFIFDGNPPTKNEFLMSICSDCAGSNVSIHSMVLASYLPCTACHFVATHTHRHFHHFLWNHVEFFGPRMRLLLKSMRRFFWRQLATHQLTLANLQIAWYTLSKSD